VHRVDDQNYGRYVDQKPKRRIKQQCKAFVWLKRLKYENFLTVLACHLVAGQLNRVVFQ
jgi:hypothetical protein